MDSFKISYLKHQINEIQLHLKFTKLLKKILEFLKYTLVTLRAVHIEMHIYLILIEIFYLTARGRVEIAIIK